LLPAYPSRDQVCLLPSCSPRQHGSSVQSRRSPAQWSTAMRATYIALLQGPSLRSRLCCPGPSSLNRPHPPLSQAHRNFAAQRFICGAFAVRERLGDPREVPRFYHRSLVACRSLRPRRAQPLHISSSFVACAGLRRRATGSALSILPISGLTDLPLLRPATLLALLPRTFTSTLSARSVTLPAGGYNYRVNWTIYAGETFTH
jgi:hypothetical protein